MKYQIDIVKKVKEDLLSKNIDSESMEEILEFVKEMSNISIPVFNALKYKGIDFDKDGTIYIYFESGFFNRDIQDFIILSYSKDEAVLSDSLGILKLDFTEKNTVFKFLCEGQHALCFYGEKKRNKEKRHNVIKNNGFLRIETSVYIDVDNLDLRGLNPDLYHIYSGKKYYHYPTANDKTDEAVFSIDTEMSFCDCLDLSIDFYHMCKVKCIDRYQPLSYVKNKQK